MSETIILRSATIDDAGILLAWRNDPTTKDASHSTSELTLNEHISWLQKTLSDTNRKIFVAQDNGIPVGTVRADFCEGAWMLSWTVAPNSRGSGVAKRMVSLLAETLCEPIRAEVKVGNIASTRVAEHVGMTAIVEVKGVIHYRREAL